MSFILKKLMPGFLIGLLVLIIVVGLSTGDLPLFAIAWAVFMLVTLLIMMQHFVWNLADEVHDGGDFLLVRRGAIEQRIPLEDIVNINYFSMRVTLLVREPGPFGREIFFLGPVSFVPLRVPRRITDLVERVDNARNTQHP